MNDETRIDYYRDLDLRMLRRSNQIRTKEMFEAFIAGFLASDERWNGEIHPIADDDISQGIRQIEEVQLKEPLSSLLESFNEWLEKGTQ